MGKTERSKCAGAHESISIERPIGVAASTFAEHSAHSRNIISGTPESEWSEQDERSGSRGAAIGSGERAFFPRPTAAATTLKRDLAVPREVNLV